MSTSIGPTLAHYRILERLPDALPGELYRAEHLEDDSEVVLRLLPPALGRERQKRLIGLATTASRLEHPNLERLLEVGETEEGRIYYCTEPERGEPLAELIAEGSLRVREALEIALQTMRGLERIHTTGIAHGALRPHYLRVTDRRRVKIAGFGLQVLEGEGLTAHGEDPLRVLAYRAPEQIRGGPADRATDVWALGILLYESITGRRPFEKGTVGALAEAILGGKPKSFASVWPEAPPELDRWLARALAKEGAKRHPGVRDLARELHAAARRIEDPTRVVMKPRRKAAGDKRKKAKKPAKTGTEDVPGPAAEKAVATTPEAAAVEPAAVEPAAKPEPKPAAAAVDPASLDPPAAGEGRRLRIATTLLLLLAALAVLWFVIL